MKERQELYCHECGGYVQFDLDLSVDGEYKLECPKCGHEHYRVVKGGVITDQRWGQDPRQNRQYTNITVGITYTSTSTAITYQGGTSSDITGSTILYSSWLNTTVSS